jgi:hypothetical protein
MVKDGGMHTMASMYERKGERYVLEVRITASNLNDF